MGRSTRPPALRLVQDTPPAAGDPPDRRGRAPDRAELRRVLERLEEESDMEAWEGLLIGQEASAEERAARDRLSPEQRQLGEALLTPLGPGAKERFARALLLGQESARRRRRWWLLALAPALLAAACLLLLLRPVPAMGPLSVTATPIGELGAPPGPASGVVDGPIGPRDSLRIELQPRGPRVGSVGVFLRGPDGPAGQEAPIVSAPPTLRLRLATAHDRPPVFRALEESRALLGPMAPGRWTLIVVYADDVQHVPTDPGHVRWGLAHPALARYLYGWTSQQRSLTLGNGWTTR